MNIFRPKTTTASSAIFLTVFLFLLSLTVHIIPAYAGAPSTPTNVVTTPVSDTEVNLTWDRVGTGETSIAILRATSTTYSIATILPSGSNIWTDTSLYPSTLYHYEIETANSQGTSSPTSAVSTTTLASGASGAAAATSFGFISASTTPTTLGLTWNDSNTNLRNWFIERSTDGISYSLISVDGPVDGTLSPMTYTDTPLTPSTTYYYRIRTVDSYGDYSNYTTAISTTTPAQPGGAPIAPTNVAATVNSATNTTLSWTDTNGGTAVYTIETSAMSGLGGPLGYTQVATTSAGATSYSLTTTAENFYYVRVRAYQNSNYSGYSTTTIVRTASSGTGSPKVYTIGPGKEYSTLGALDWATLGPGDTVEIYPQMSGSVDTPYYEKPMISVRGTAAAPITIEGVPDPTTGDLPIIDGTNAVEDNPEWQDHYQPVDDIAFVLIGTRADQTNSGYTPGYFALEDLEIRNGYQGDSGGNTYTSYSGTVYDYSSPCGIYIEDGDHITIKGNIIHGNGGEGIFGAGQSDNRNLEDVLIDSNYIYGNGTIGSEGIHETYMEGINVTYQYNDYGPERSGAAGSDLKDRGAGTIIRYNWLEGGARVIDLVEAQNYAPTTLLLPSYHKTYVYGNILYNDNSTDTVHYGGDQGVPMYYRKGVLYFYNNTFFNSNGGKILEFDESSPAESVDARNNIFVWYTGSQYWEDELLQAYGTAYFGANWASPYWELDFSGSPFTGHAANSSAIITNSNNDPGFVSSSTENFNITGSSQVLNQESTLWGDALPVQYEYAGLASNNVPTSTPRATANDLGAFEYGGADVTPPTVSVTAPTSAQVVGGTSVTLSATASDNVAVAGVTFYVDGVKTGSQITSSPYTYSWNSTATSSGSNNIFAVAEDTSGNYATSSSISFTVDNTPPTPGSIIFSSVTNTSLIASSTGASDNVALATKPYQYHNVTSGTYSGATSTPWALTGLSANTSYSFTIGVEDSAGNWATTTSYSTTTLSGITAPSITTSAPTSVGPTSLTLNATITSTGGANASQSGFAYGTTANLSSVIATSTLGAQTGTASFNQIVSSLTHSTLYYFRAYVTNSAATAYGSILSTTTLASDTTPPMVSLTSPTTGATVSGTTALTATASDNIAVSNVTFYLDGTALSTAITSSPYTYSWDTTQDSNASHTLSAVATDSSGNTATSTISVTVSNGGGSTSGGSSSGSSSGGGGGGGGGIIAVPTITPATTTPSTTCSPGELFSTTTGAPCASTLGCTGTSAFSTVTGEPCPEFGGGATPSSGTPLPLLTQTLSLGMTNTNVTTLQDALIDLTFLHVTPTGYYGTLTEASVKAFQTAHNIPPVGNVGPLTKAALNDIITSVPLTVPLTTSPTPPTTPTPTTPTTFTKDLYLGISDPQVALLQHYLDENDFIVSYSGPGSLNDTSDYFGPATKAALERFQRYNNINPTGYFGEESRAAIQ